ncbi:MAG: AMP-binding protein [Deltaproteobacteria bacterium]|nr:AMP-binding protein [Deltaproteobacteria bacterium]
MGTPDVGRLLSDAAERQGDRVAFVETGARRREVSAARLELGARRVAGWLAAQGVRPGDRVGLQMPNGIAFVEAWFGVIHAGATVVPIPTRSTAAEVEVRARTAGMRVLLAPAGSAAGARPGGDTGWRRLDPAAAEREKATESSGVRPAADAMLLFTSGTTSGARGVRIGHEALLAHTRALADHTLGLGADDVLLGVLPLTHSFGLRMVMLMGLATGARVVLEPSFSASGSMATMHAEAVSFLPAVPTMFAAWAALPEAPPPPALRWCLSAGAPLEPAVLEAAERRLGAEIRQGYGMTEATFSTVDAPPAPRSVGSVGRPVPGVELRVVDDRGRDLPPGEVGEVLVRGPHLMSGYLGEDAGSEPLDADGFLRSGDLGTLDERGRLRVVDRTRDLVIRGGENVYPSEVESHLADHPSIAQVAVVGRPDPFFGEVVVAVVVPAAGAAFSEEAVLAFARERLSPHKVPVRVLTVDAMPVGPSGKVLKRTLRERVVSGDPGG